MNNRNGIIRPDAINIETTFAPGPLAQPAVVTMQGPGQMKILAIGGLSKVEALAGQIAAGAIQQGVIAVPPPSPDDDRWTPVDGDKRTAEFEMLVAARSVSLAEAILAECERRVKERQ